MGGKQRGRRFSLFAACSFMTLGFAWRGVRERRAWWRWILALGMAWKLAAGGNDTNEQYYLYRSKSLIDYSLLVVAMFSSHLEMFVSVRDHQASDPFLSKFLSESWFVLSSNLSCVPTRRQERYGE